jgi:hypothetical protein
MTSLHNGQRILTSTTQHLHSTGHATALAGVLALTALSSNTGVEILAAATTHHTATALCECLADCDANIVPLLLGALDRAVNVEAVVRQQGRLGQSGANTGRTPGECIDDPRTGTGVVPTPGIESAGCAPSALAQPITSALIDGGVTVAVLRCLLINMEVHYLFVVLRYSPMNTLLR